MFERIIRFCIEQRWLVILAVLGMAGLGVYNYSKLPVDGTTQLRQCAHSVLRTRPLDSLLEPPQVLLRDVSAQSLLDSRDVEARVPDLEVPHGREPRHRLAVLAHGLGDEHLPSRLVEPEVAAGDRDARSESLHVPLERPRQRLVEVVDAEDEAPVGRRKDSEVREVRVTAELGMKPCSRPGREIGGHQICTAAEEREWRLEHASVADRDELREACLPLFLEELDRIPAMRRGLPASVGRAW